MQLQSEVKTILCVMYRNEPCELCVTLYLCRKGGLVLYDRKMEMNLIKDTSHLFVLPGAKRHLLLIKDAPNCGISERHDCFFWWLTHS